MDLVSGDQKACVESHGSPGPFLGTLNLPISLSELWFSHPSSAAVVAFPWVHGRLGHCVPLRMQDSYGCLGQLVNLPGIPVTSDKPLLVLGHGSPAYKMGGPCEVGSPEPQSTLRGEESNEAKPFSKSL
jgi:hypothetical protein